MTTLSGATGAATDRDVWATTVEQVTPGVHRIPIGLRPDDPLKAVNVYAVEGPQGLGLIDGGWFVPGALDELRRGLAEMGAEIADVTGVLATHFHPDHYTLAVEIRRRTGCPLMLGAADSQTVEAMMSEGHGLDDFATSLRRCGVPSELIQRHLRSGAGAELYEHPSGLLYDGDHPTLGGVELEALATPGHTRGHFCFAHDEDGLLFAGDHVLPHITPSIGYETVGSHLPLADYLASLRRVRERPDARLLPAHGPLGPSVHARVDELIAHHDVRLRRCGDAVAAGATTAYEVAQRIPWMRRERPFSELSPFDQLMAVHETVAHLDVLDMQGRVQTLAGESVDRYIVT